MKPPDEFEKLSFGELDKSLVYPKIKIMSNLIHYSLDEILPTKIQIFP